MTTQLTIRLKQTGTLPNGKPSLGPIQINDLDTGHEFQLRKVRVYVPLNGTIDIPASDRSLLSIASGVIKKYVTAGTLTAELFVQPPSFTNGTRPAANLYPAGTQIWNTSDNAPNWSDGTNWRDATGTIT